MSIDQTIVRAQIHPGIGIARVGNSTDPEGYFIGPEVVHAPSLPLAGYKDATGALKRQVARFRVYGYNRDNELVREVTAADATITWTVHLANKKAAWYEFHHALDLDDAEAPKDQATRRRNRTVTGDERRQLVIDPGPRSIRGEKVSGKDYRFDSGKFFKLDVSLGELRTDESGRLLVFGGTGVARSAADQPPLDFANNDAWHDDVSDGPVDAKVVLDGHDIPVDGAWIAVAPPNYAPTLNTVRTLYDLLFDRMVTWGLLKPPPAVSFQRHIRPIFERLSGLQWVNQGFASYFGAGAPFDAAKLLIRLADAHTSNREFRERVFANFRNTRRPGALGKYQWPEFYGDALDSMTPVGNQNPDSSLTVPNGLASLSGLQLGWLQRWAAGDFAGDLDLSPGPTSLDQVPLARQPDALDEAALTYCLADAFHPGCELTWPMRIRTLYSKPFRIKRRPAEFPEQDFGDELSRDVALSVMGPLNGATPGDLTRWMAVPWQTDTASCLSGYSFFRTSESLPSFWPARVPNDVLREVDYQILMDATKTRAERVAAFFRRQDWFRVFDGNGNSDIAQMITDFHKLGIIEERAGPNDVPEVPAKIWVESKPALVDPVPLAPGADSPPAMLPSRYLLRRFGPGRR